MATLEEVARRVEFCDNRNDGEVILYRRDESEKSWEIAVLLYRDGFKDCVKRFAYMIGDYPQTLLTVTPRGMRLLLDVLDVDEEAVFISRYVLRPGGPGPGEDYWSCFARALKSRYNRGFDRVLSSEVKIGDPLLFDPIASDSHNGFISMKEARRVYADISADTPPLTENPVTGMILENNAPPGFGNTDQQVNPASGLAEVARRWREGYEANPDALTLIYKWGTSWECALLEVGGVQWDKELSACVIDLGNTPMSRLREIYEDDHDAIVFFPAPASPELISDKSIAWFIEQEYENHGILPLLRSIHIRIAPDGLPLPFITFSEAIPCRDEFFLWRRRYHVEEYQPTGKPRAG